LPYLEIGIELLDSYRIQKAWINDFVKKYYTKPTLVVEPDQSSRLSQWIESHVLNNKYVAEYYECVLTRI